MLVAFSKDMDKPRICELMTAALSPWSECQEVIDDVNTTVMDTKEPFQISITSSITVDI